MNNTSLDVQPSALSYSNHLVVTKSRWALEIIKTFYSKYQQKDTIEFTYNFVWMTLLKIHGLTCTLITPLYFDYFLFSLTCFFIIVINTCEDKCSSEVFFRKDVLKICSKCTGERPCWWVISIKLKIYWNHTSAWMLSCNFAAYPQNNFS